MKLLNDSTGTYRITIEYRGIEYSYICRRISFLIGEELWFLWAANNRLLKLKYNKSLGILTEDLLPGQKPEIPDDFIQALQKEFSINK